MTAEQVLAVAKVYTDKAVEGAGGTAGKNCEIQSIEPITGGNRITFVWYDEDQVLKTETLDVMDGADGTNGQDGQDGTDGVGISSITFKETDQDGNNVYTVNLTDGNDYDVTCPIGPQGETGETGPQGPAGPTGPAGSYTAGTGIDITNAVITNKAWEFSSTEKVIGKWIDGKPIYQKTISLGTLPNNTTKTVAHGISKLKRMLNYFGYGASPTYQISLPYPCASTSVVEIYFDITNITIVTKTNLSSVSEAYLTLQYTKTTD